MIILFVYLIKPQINENHSVRNNKYLSKNELFLVLKNNTDYYNTFNKNDFKVRNINSIPEYIDKIQKSIGEFNSFHTNKLDYISHIADQKIKKINITGFNGQKCSQIKWKFGLIKNKDYENGLPHTIKDIIILPRYVMDHFNNNELTRLLIHEKVHVYQRMFPNDIKEYLKSNNFTIYKKKDINDNIRANPDLDQYIYKRNNLIYKSKYNDNPLSLLDVDPKDQNFEHPFEEMAINLAKSQA